MTPLTEIEPLLSLYDIDYELKRVARQYIQWNKQMRYPALTASPSGRPGLKILEAAAEHFYPGQLRPHQKKP